MSKETVREQLKAYGLEDRIVTMDESLATVQLAAEALGIEPDQIAKTMAFMVKDEPVLIVMAGEARVDNHKYRDAFGTKAKMMTPDQLLAYVGHPAGGVSPFGVRDGVKIYLDKTLHRHSVFYPSAGDPDNAVRVSVEEMEKITHPAGWVDVAKESE
jgi:prolyl-tRNA editing enzyme YbaK/EbsC (Cys-tRNA(Pro) deacylase)